MIFLEVHHHKTFIKKADKADIESVREALTVFKKKFQLNEYQQPEWDITYLLSYKDYSFPTAYLDAVKEHFHEEVISYHIEDLRSYPAPNLPKLMARVDLSLRQDQKDAFSAIKDNDTGIIMMPTATGKSRVIIKTIDYRKVRTLVIVPKQNLQDQLTMQLKKTFGPSRVDMIMPQLLREKIKAGLVRDQYGEVTNNPIIEKVKFSLDPDLFKKEKSDEKEEKTSLMNDLYKTPVQKTKFTIDMEALGGKAEEVAPEKQYLLDKKQKKQLRQAEAKKKLWEKKKEKLDIRNQIVKYKDVYIFCDASLDSLPQEFLDQFQMVIIDECHHSSASMIRECLLKLKNCAYRYYFSATPWRDHPADQQLLVSSIGSKRIYELSPEEAIKLQSIAKPKYIQKHSPENKNYMKGLKKWRDVLEQGIIGNENRNKMIVEDALKDLDAGENVFIAMDEISHLEILKERFRQQGVIVDCIHGEQPRKVNQELIEKVGNQQSGITIGTMSVGEGTDMPNISSVILASGGKSSIRFLQRIGRGARKGTNQDKVAFIVRDYFDWFYDRLMRHSMVRKKVFDTYFENYGE